MDDDGVIQTVQKAVQDAKYNDVVTVDIGNNNRISESSESISSSSSTSSSKNPGVSNASSDEIVLVASLDQSNGGIVWRRADSNPPPSTSSDTSNSLEDDENEDVGIMRHLRTKKWIIPMLHDIQRNSFYNLAIQKACTQVYTLAEQKDSTKYVQVLDIGTGTGLLAMMAARSLETITDTRQLKNENNDKPKIDIKITSLEMASAMARIAQHVVTDNDLHNLIQIIPAHSCDAEFHLPRRATLCTSELLESGLLGEGILPTLRDAWKRHLDPQAVMVPRKARIFAQVVESEDHIACYRGPSSSALGANASTRLTTTRPSSSLSSFSSSSDNNNVEDQSLLLNEVGDDERGHLVPIRAEALLKQPSVNVLTDPVIALEFDFSSAKTIPPPEGGSKSISITPSSSGVAHGVLFWWELDLWEGITYSTKPKLDSDKPQTESDHKWQDHWQQCLYVFSTTGDKCPRLEKDIPLELVAYHTDFAVSFSISPSTSPSFKRQKLIPPIPITRFSVNRALQLSNIDRIQALNDAIQTALKKCGQDAAILDLSDFSLGAILAATGENNRAKILEEGKTDMNATNVNSVETGDYESSPWTKLSSRVAQIGNELPRKDSIFQIWNTRPEMLKSSLLFPVDDPSEMPFGGWYKLGDRKKPAADPDRKVEIVVAEPYYEKLEGWHVQEALNFYYILRGLQQIDKSEHFLSPNVKIIPQCARIMGCAVQLNPEMARAYGPLVNDNVEKYHRIKQKSRSQRKQEVEEASICGFDHSILNLWRRKQIDKYDQTLYMWQYGYSTLTEPFPLGAIDYSQASSASNQGLKNTEVWEKVPFQADGICHGMMVWVEYELDNFSSPKVISTNTRYNEQILRMLKSPENVSKDQDFFCYRATFGGINEVDVETHSLFLKVEKNS